MRRGKRFQKRGLSSTAVSAATRPSVSPRRSGRSRALDGSRPAWHARAQPRLQGRKNARCHCQVPNSKVKIQTVRAIQNANGNRRQYSCNRSRAYVCNPRRQGGGSHSRRDRLRRPQPDAAASTTSTQQQPALAFKIESYPAWRRPRWVGSENSGRFVSDLSCGTSHRRARPRLLTGAGVVHSRHHGECTNPGPVARLERGQE